MVLKIDKFQTVNSYNLYRQVNPNLNITVAGQVGPISHIKWVIIKKKKKPLYTNSEYFIIENINFEPVCIFQFYRLKPLCKKRRKKKDNNNNN